jgi:hypothetical protein
VTFVTFLTAHLVHTILKEYGALRTSLEGTVDSARTTARKIPNKEE